MLYKMLQYTGWFETTFPNHTGQADDLDPLQFSSTKNKSGEFSFQSFHSFYKPLPVFAYFYVISYTS